MTGASRRQRIQALLFAAIMVVSMVAAGVGGLAGSAAAETTVSDEGSIQDAINDAESGELITVESGSYDGFVVNKSVRIQAADGTTVTSDGVKVGDSDRDGSVVVTADDVVIDGIELDGENSETNRGVIVEGATNLTINSSDIHDYRTGITFGSEGTTDSDITIEQNTISNNVAGIGSTDDVRDLEIDGNNFNENEEGIGLGGGVSVESISNNDFESNDRHIKDYRSDVNETLLQNVKSGNNFDAAVTVENDTGTLQTGIFGSIQPAVDNTQDGDTVQVPPGTYDESVSISTKNVTVEGPNAGINANSDARSDEAVIAGQVDVSAQNVTVNGLQVTPNTATFNQKPAAAIIVSESDAKVQNNRIADFTVSITDIGVNSIQGIQVYNAGDEITGIEIQSNSVENITYEGSSQAPSGTFGTDYGNLYGIHVQGEIGDTVVEQNTIRDLTSDGYTLATAVSGTDSDQTTNPEEIVVKSNIYENLNAKGLPATAFTISGDRVNATNLRVNNNSINAPVGVHNGANENLDATSNWWGATNGPSGDFDGNGSAVTGPVSVDPATVSLDDGSVSLTQDFLGVVEDSQNVTLNDTSDATFSFDSESVPGDVDGTLVLEINGTDYVFENVLDDGAINTSASGAEVDSGKDGTSIADTTPTGDTDIDVAGNGSETTVEEAGSVRLVHEVQNTGEGYSLTSIPQPAEVYTTDVSDFTSWDNANTNFDDASFNEEELVSSSEPLHKGQYAFGTSSNARIGYDYVTPSENDIQLGPGGSEDLSEGFHLVGSNYNTEGAATTTVDLDLDTVQDVPDTDAYNGDESFVVYDPANFNRLGGNEEIGSFDAYWVYVDEGEDTETRVIKLARYDPAA